MQEKIEDAKNWVLETASEISDELGLDGKCQWENHMNGWDLNVLFENFEYVRITFTNEELERIVLDEKEIKDEAIGVINKYFKKCVKG